MATYGTGSRGTNSVVTRNQPQRLTPVPSAVVDPGPLAAVGGLSLSGSGGLSFAVTVDTAGTLALSGSGTLAAAALTATPYATEVLADTPIADWRLGEPSGTNALDSSGNSHTGTYTGSPAPTLGAAGLLVGDADTAVTFASASSQWVNILDDPAWDTSSVTVECLVKATTLTGTRRIMARMTGSNYTWVLYCIAGVLTWVARSNGTTDITVTGPTLVNGTTYHIAATFDGTTARLYVNGVEYDNTPGGVGGLIAANYPIGIAARPAVGEYWNGVIDECSVYGTALSPTRIAAHYAAAAGLGGPGVAVSGSVTLTGSGTLTFAAAPALPASLALSGAGSLSLAGTPAVTGSVALSGTGTLTFATAAAASGTVALSGTGTLSTSALIAVTGSVSLAGEGTLSTSALAGASGTVALAGDGTLSTAGLPALDSTLDLAGEGTLTTSGLPDVTGTTALSGEGTLDLTGEVGTNPEATLTLTGSGTLTVAGLPALTALAQLSGEGTLTVIGVPFIASRDLNIAGATVTTDRRAELSVTRRTGDVTGGWAATVSTDKRGTVSDG